MYEYQCKILRVLDGNTLDVAIDLGFGLTAKKRVHLLGVNAPSVRTKDEVEKALGMDAKAYVRKWCEKNEGAIRIKTTQKEGNFGRLFAEVFVDGSPLSLNQLLISTKHASPDQP